MTVNSAGERPAHIQTLVSSVDRYNPSNCHLLEEYLQQQLANDTYDLLANLALLKLYQFNPSLCSSTAVLQSLVLPLAHAPFQADFALAWSLLSDSFVNGAALPPPPPGSDDDDDDDDEAPPRAAAQPHGEKATADRLRQLNDLMLARKFKAFWSLLRNGAGAEGGADEQLVHTTIKDLLADAKGFEDRTRASIAQEVEQSFRGLARKTLESFMGLEGKSSELDTLVKNHGWTFAGEEVKFPKNSSNSPTSTVTNEKIGIEQLSRLLGRTQA